MFAAAMWGFTFFTMTRSGYVGMIFSTIFFLLIRKWMFKERVIRVVGSGLMMLLITTISIPIIFVSIRYIPALRHHPVFNVTYSETLVHSWDPIDSDKYTSVKDVVYGNLERLHIVDDQYTIYRLAALRAKYGDSFIVNEAEDFTPAEVAEPAPDGERVIAYADGEEPGTDIDHPAYTNLTYNNWFEKFLGIRKYIYAYYFRRSGFWGNSEEYVTGALGDGRIYTSAHNSLLDFTSRYGYIAGILLLALQISMLINGMRRIKKAGQNADMGIVYATICTIAFFAWGIFYSVMYTGNILDTLFWTCIVFVTNKSEKK
jgi:hypothetical protein